VSVLLLSSLEQAMKVIDKPKIKANSKFDFCIFVYVIVQKHSKSMPMAIPN
jgi:hypothetical protein